MTHTVQAVKTREKKRTAQHTYIYIYIKKKKITKLQNIKNNKIKVPPFFPFYFLFFVFSCFFGCFSFFFFSSLFAVVFCCFCCYVMHFICRLFEVFFFFLSMGMHVVGHLRQKYKKREINLNYFLHISIRRRLIESHKETSQVVKAKNV